VELLALDRGARRQRVAQVLNRVGLEAFGERYPRELSCGQQQRVTVARAMAPALLLDEPVSNLAADLRAQMRRDIHAILRGTRTTASSSRTTRRKHSRWRIG